eukprot:jgi/Ulvmu1/743/UM010_0116.1
MSKPVWQQTVKLQKSKDKWIDGELSLSHDAMAFSGDESFQIMLSALTGPGIQKAKGQPILRVVAGKASRVFKFASIDARESFLDVVTPLKEAQSAQQPSVVPKKSTQEAVFSAHNDVAALYQRLVAPGHVTEAEFWSSKRAVVRAVLAQSISQKIGLPSKLLSVLDAPVDTRTGKVSINITPALERQIFAEYPAVAAMFAGTVPHARSRKQFFEEFVKALKNRITRRRKRAAGTLSANDELLTDFEEELQRFEDDIRKRRRAAAAARAAAADPTVDVAADSHDGFSSGYGVRHGPGREAAATGMAGAQAADLAQELNTHGAAVLDDGGGAPGAAAEPAAAEAARQELQKRARSGLEDLQPAQARNYTELHIQDPQKYFRQIDSVPAPGVKPEPGADAAMAAEDDGPLDALHAVAAEHAQLRSAGGAGEAADAALSLTAPAHALAALEDVHASSQIDVEPGTGGRRLNPAAALLPEMIQGSREHVLGVNELLRHFWTCWPASSAARIAKLKRVVAALEGVYRQTEALRAACDTQDRPYMSQLLAPSLRAMDAALGKYDAEIAAKVGT